MRLIIFFPLLLFFMGCGLILPDLLNTNDISDSDLAGILFINEVSGDNPEQEDWVELYNNDSDAVELSGFYLSDSSSNLTRWTFPDNTYIAGKSFLVITCDSKDRDLHTNFKLNAGVEGIYLSTPREAVTMDSILTIPTSGTGSYGRTTDGALTWQIFTTPTKGRPNS